MLRLFYKLLSQVEGDLSIMCPWDGEIGSGGGETRGSLTASGDSSGEMICQAAKQ